jgi:hypothetical protein
VDGSEEIGGDVDFVLEGVGGTGNDRKVIGVE